MINGSKIWIIGSQGSQAGGRAGPDKAGILLGPLPIVPPRAWVMDKLGFAVIQNINTQPCELCNGIDPTPGSLPEPELESAPGVTPG